MLVVDISAVFKSRPSKSTGTRNFCSRQPVEIVSGGGTIVITPFFLNNIPMTVKQVPSLTHLLVCKIEEKKR